MPRNLTSPRLFAMLAVASILLTLAVADVVAGAIAAIGLTTGLVVVRYRTRGVLRAAVVVAVVAASIVGVLVALTLPTFRGRPSALVVTSATAPSAPPARVTGGGAATGGVGATLGSPAGGVAVQADASGAGFESLGFVATDYDDSGAGVDRDAAKLSSLAATGIVLASSPGAIEVQAATDSLVRAHLGGARAFAVVSNYDGNDFNGPRALAMLAAPDAQRRFSSAVATVVAKQGWDGIVLDLERLPPAARGRYVGLVQRLKDTLGNRAVLVAVPATTDPADPDLTGYDLAGLGRAADAVVWMAYDQHELADAPGPIAGMPWVRRTLAVAEAAIPRTKLLLGVAGYGYAWRSAGHAEEVTAPQGRDLAAAPGAHARWDDVEQEWDVRTADGREVWYEDARSGAARVQLAVDDHLLGTALWRVGSEDPALLDHLGVRVAKHAVAAPQRDVVAVPASGLVALTFDDGPDPKWTPAILGVLQRLHVPATFFVIGTQAQSHQALVRAEVRDGNLVANHTYSHQNLSRLSRLQARAEIEGGEAVIEGIIGRRPALFRSPYGAGDMTGGSLGSDQLAADLGLHPVPWNDDPGDWLRPPADVVVQHVLDNATERTVVLLHDGGGNRAATVAALPRIIAGLQARGYVFTTVDALDGSIATPYFVRRGWAAEARGLGIIAAFRLDMAARRVVLWTLLGIAFISLFRLVAAGGLALAHALRTRRPAVRLLPQGLSVSVIVPAHNEQAVLGKTLAGVQALRHAGASIEVIVVDDGSTDATVEVARRFPVAVVSQRRAGKAAALNRGIEIATGEVVIVLDADTVLHAAFLEEVLPHFADERVDAVAANIKVGNQRKLLARLQALEYLVSLNLDRRAQAMLNVVAVVPGAAGAFRRSAVLAAGGYQSDTMVEDADLTVALLLAGSRIVYESHAVALTEAPETAREVFKQRRRWSFGTVEVAAKHADSLLDRRAGRVGLIGLPWMLLSQVVLPLLGPIADVYLLYLVFVGGSRAAIAMLGIAVGLDVATCVIVVALEREDWRLAAVAPLLRVVWRPLQLLAVAYSFRRWVQGRGETWRQLERHNSVDVARLAAA